MSEISQSAPNSINLGSWRERLFGSVFRKLGIGVSLIAISMVIVVSFSHYAYRSIQEDLATSSIMLQSRSGYKILYLIRKMASSQNADHSAIREEIYKVIAQVDQAMHTIVSGDKEHSSKSRKKPDNLEKLRTSANYWIVNVTPMLESTIREITSSGEDVAAHIAMLDRTIVKHSILTNEGLNTIRDAIVEGISFTQKVQIALSIVAIFMLLIVLFMLKDASTRAKELTIVADKIADGDLKLEIPVNGNDEFSILGSSFNAVTSKLAGMIDKEREDKQQLKNIVETIRDTSERLADSASNLLKSASVQAAGMQQQAAVLTSTVNSVNEVRSTTTSAVEGAAEVASSSSQAAEVSKNGRQAIDETVKAMTVVQRKSDAIAESIHSLSQDGKSIEQIVTAVNDIADQTNMLALNAAIEASRAGEHGRGFSVVASEIRSLAEKSKLATAQVQHILSKILHSTNEAVELTDIGRNSVEQALNTVEKAGSTIRTLEEIVSEAARMAAEISAAAELQSAGMNQIQFAITHISDVSDKNLEAMKDTAETAEKLNDIGYQLKHLATLNG